MKPPRIQKRHKKASEKQVRRTCWRSIKWKIAILCCSTQSRKGGGCNNIFLITFLLSQVYLLHRFGLHRKDQFDQLTNQKRSYPIPQNLQQENSNLPVPSELRNLELNAVRTVNIKPDRLLFHDQEGKSIEMEKSQNAQSSTTKITSSKSSSSTIVSPTSPKSSSPSSSISASSVQSSSTSIISSSKISTTSSTSSSSKPSEAQEAPANMYDSIEYEYNAIPIKNIGDQETPANSEDSDVNSQTPLADDTPENGQSEEIKETEGDGDENASELENPGDYYLNEGDDDETTTNSKNFLDSPSLTSIFFDIPDPGSFPPGT